jgi:hypothetical protein
MTRYDVRCGQAPWENTTTDLDSAIDLAYHLSEDYQCDVNFTTFTLSLRMELLQSFHAKVTSNLSIPSN